MVKYLIDTSQSWNVARVRSWKRIRWQKIREWRDASTSQSPKTILFSTSFQKLKGGKNHASHSPGDQSWSLRNVTINCQVRHFLSARRKSERADERDNRFYWRKQHLRIHRGSSNWTQSKRNFRKRNLSGCPVENPNKPIYDSQRSESSSKPKSVSVCKSTANSGKSESRPNSQRSHERRHKSRWAASTHLHAHALRTRTQQDSWRCH